MAEGQSKLETWKSRLEESAQVWDAQVSKMDAREQLYRGSNSIEQIVKKDTAKETPHVRNIIFENIESQVSAVIPQPKVIARNPRNEKLAAIIEHWERNELVRQGFEQMNDLAERTVPIQGGTVWHEEWDSTKGGHNEAGQLVTTQIHPKMLAPQPGVSTDIEDMDWIILKIPTTKDKIKRIYDVDVTDEGESEPELRGTGNEDKSEDIVTEYIGYSRNEHGGIDKYVWCNDKELENLENYQARRLPVCGSCGRVRPMIGQVISNAVEVDFDNPAEQNQETAQMAAGRELAGQIAAAPGSTGAEQEAGADPEVQQAASLLMQGVNMLKGAEPPEEYDGGACPWCGANDWIDQEQGYEAVYIPIHTAMGNEIPGEHPERDPETGEVGMAPTLVPFYRPDVYPVVLQKNVSVFGQLLGSSDVDIIQTQQNTTNRLELKIITRLLEAGSRITLPAKGKLTIDPEDNTKWYLSGPQDKACIGLYEFKGDLHYELAYLSQVYEEARQILGITDSFQGRKDTTAKSASAKEFSAQQAAGRLQSKRTMKNAAYAKLFELMFKFQLAYADEPRFVIHHNEKGELVYEEFNRYDFLEKDPLTGEWYWNDDFIFSVDTSAPLSSNQEAMWQETRMNFEGGTFGPPDQIDTLILFWTKMELLHYPGAASTKKYLENKKAQEQAAAEAAMAPGMGGPGMAPPIPGGPEVPGMPPIPGGPGGGPAPMPPEIPMPAGPGGPGPGLPI